MKYSVGRRLHYTDSEKVTNYFLKKLDLGH